MKTPTILNSALLAGAALLAFTSSLKAQTTIAGWDFDAGGAIAAPYNSPVATSGTGQALQLGMNNNYTFNGGEGPGSIAWSDVLASAGASTGAGSFGWRVRGPSNSSGGGSGQSNGWNSQAPIATQGAEFSLSTAGFTGLTITADVNVTTQAERNLAVEYTLDDTVANPVWLNATITSAGSLGAIATNSSSTNTISGNYVKLASAGTGWNNGITASIPSSANGDPNFAVEIVNASTGADCVNSAGNALNNSSGNWRYDNVVVSGTAVPEPSTGVAVLGGLGILLGFGKMRRGSRKA